MIIDTHAHVWESFMSFTCPSVEKIIQGMDSSGIDITVFSSLSGLINTDPAEDNLFVKKLIDTYPGRFRGECVVTPYAGDKALAEFEKCVTEYKFIGLKLHPWIQGYAGGADFLAPLLDLCGQYDVPVIFHTGTPPYAQAFHLWVQAKRFPKVRFIFGHSGLNYQWRDALETGKMCPNTYFDTSGISYMFAVKRIIKELGAHRVMFGSDNPFLFPETELEKVKNLGLHDRDMEMILWKTAKEVFRTSFAE
jgi:uncharacterized protein